MDRFVKRENIEHYRRLREAQSPAERRKILGSLAEERAQFKLEFRSDDPARIAASSSTAATNRPRQ